MNHYKKDCSENVGQFLNNKRQVLQKVDASRKGNIDIPIQHLVSQINACNDFYTTSSCSGRVALYCESSDNKKYLCKWLFMSHTKVDEAELIEKIDPQQGNITLKFEPMILHVQCISLACAKKLHTCALEAGFRNSGITLGKHCKITLAVRSCLGLEVPISDNGVVLVSNVYLQFLVRKANDKMDENLNRLEKFCEIFKHVFQ